MNKSELKYTTINAKFDLKVEETNDEAFVQIIQPKLPKKLENKIASKL